MRYFCIIIIFSWSVLLHSQNYQIAGIVVDADNKEPLAFVNIVYNSDNNGTTTNIDGKFKILTNQKIEYIKISYLGYEPLIILKEKLTFTDPLYIELTKNTYQLSEAVVVPGINPAHRIINKTIENRDLNNPEKIRSFSYTSYNKLYFTVDNKNKISRKDTIILTDSLIQAFKKRINLNDETDNNSEKDTNSLRNYLNDYHFFIMESVSERKFIYPDKNNEKVIATRVAGLKQPSFMLLATQLQSFSFYNEQIIISDKNYLNPISEGSTAKYLFILEDTMFSENNDTIYIISYRPFKGKNFDGLKGILHINTNKYAIQSVIAEPYEQEKTLNIKIQQNYIFIDGIQWFPSELNTDLLMPNFLIPDKKDTILLNDTSIIKVSSYYPIIGIGKTYLSQISINPELDKKEFTNLEIEVENDAHQKDDNFWNSYRYNSLSSKDLNTYKLIDSIGKAEKLDLKFKLIETVSQGFIPWKFLNIDYKSILLFNSYEGYRTGLGLMTNEQISKFFSIGGYVAYGFRDDGIKYGGILKIIPKSNNDLKIKFSLINDVDETGGILFHEDNMIFGTDLYRNLMVDFMHQEKKIQSEFQITFFQYLHANLIFRQSEHIFNSEYIYSDFPVLEQVLDIKTPYSFNTTETELQFKYAYKEKFMKTPRGYKISLGTNYPIVWFNLTKKFSVSGEKFEYFKAETKVSKSFLSKSFGKLSIQTVAGYTNKSLPFSLQYNGHGSYRPWVIESANSFGTARMNEFFNTRFIYVFLRHDFASLLFKTKKFHPKILLCQNFGYGALDEPEYHYGTSARSMEKGFHESGILFNNLISQSFFGYGIGLFYRYGPYSYKENIDNFAGKITLYIYL